MKRKSKTMYKMLFIYKDKIHECNEKKMEVYILAWNRQRASSMWKSLYGKPVYTLMNIESIRFKSPEYFEHVLTAYE